MAISTAISSLANLFSLLAAIWPISPGVMAGRRGGWINWDALRLEEAVEDAAGLNYDYEFVVLDQGLPHDFSILS
jgi:hypothetical protein